MLPQVHPNALRHKPVGWRKYQPVIFTAILIGFPLSNVLLFFCTQMFPLLTNMMDSGTPAVISTGHYVPHEPTMNTHTRSKFNISEGDGVYAKRGNESEKNMSMVDKYGYLDAAVREDPMYRTYESFFVTGAQSWRIQKYGRVCIVSDDFLGLVVSSGAGTVMTTLAETLSNNGFDVTLLYTRGDHAETADVDFWVQYYASRGIRLVPLPHTPVVYDVPHDVAISHRIFIWLSQQQWFDAVHFPDRRGRAYFTLTAKKQNIAFMHTYFMVHAVAPHIWYKTNSLQTLDTLHDLIMDHLERQSIKMADYVISPSEYMWMEENSWPLNKTRTAIHPNLLPTWVQRRSRVLNEEVVVLELVFFTRFELRKGIVLFCDLLDQLALRGKKADMEGVKVTFLGQLPESANEKLTMKGGVRVRTDEYIKQRAKKWKFPWQILKDMDTQARYDYLLGGNRLAILPSIMENSPYTVLECLTMGIPMVASNVGGTSELVHPDDVDKVLTIPTPKPLAKRIREILREGLRPGRPRVFTDVDKTWVVWHHMLMYRAKASSSAMSTLLQFEEPLVTIIIVTYNNPHFLKQALQSIAEQEYTQSKIEVVLVDDGSTLPEAQAYLKELSKEFERKGWTYKQQDNRGPGAARNLGAGFAKGEFIMFMDDDNYAKAREISTFVSVAMHTKADVLTCTNDYFYGNDAPGPDKTPTGRWVPLGAATTVGMFQNLYGDTNAMIRRKVFIDLGGFPEDYGYALEDWELFSKSVLGGYKLESIPEPLYWYRLRDTSHSHSTAKFGNAARTIRPYLKQIPQGLHHLVLFAQGMKDSHDLAHVELESKHDSMKELRKMLKALATSLDSLCRDGKIPQNSKNLLQNSQFNMPGPVGGAPVLAWRPFGGGYVHDPSGGRISYGSEDAYAVRMHNAEWKESRGAMQSVILDQDEPAAVVISGWSKALDVSGAVDSGYAIYIDISFKDGKRLWGYTISFDTGSHGWQFKAGVIDPEVAIHSLQLYTMFRWHSGTVWFDDLSVNTLKEGLCDYTQLTLEGLAESHEKEKEDL